MSELYLEELMLTSSQENFFEIFEKVEQNIAVSNTIFGISNDIELLRDILSKASLHLDCYKTFERLLDLDYSNLVHQKNRLTDQLKIFKKNEDQKTLTVSLENFKGAEEGRIYLEDQIVKFKQGLVTLDESKESLIDSIDVGCRKMRIKDVEMKNLENEIARKKRSAKGKSSNLIFKKIVQEKLKLKENDRISATSIKGSTVESSRGSSSHN